MYGDYPAVQSYAPVGWCPNYPYTPEPMALQWSPGITGLGQRSTGQTIAVSAPQITGGVLTAVASSGGIWGMAPALAIPVIGVVVAGVTMGLVALFSRKGPKQKVATTEIVNKVEPLLKQNLQGYLSGPRTRSSQAQALANFDAGWQYILDNCGISEMGDPGQWCINDRKSGACEWKASCSREVDGGCVDYTLNPGGVCWNWFVGYRDPIANDPGVKPDPIIGASGGGISDVLGSITGGGSGGLLLIAGLILIGVMFIGGGKQR